MSCFVFALAVVVVAVVVVVVVVAAVADQSMDNQTVNREIATNQQQQLLITAVAIPF